MWYTLYQVNHFKILKNPIPLITRTNFQYTKDL